LSYIHTHEKSLIFTVCISTSATQNGRTGELPVISPDYEHSSKSEVTKSFCSCVSSHRKSDQHTFHSLTFHNHYR